MLQNIWRPQPLYFAADRPQEEKNTKNQIFKSLQPPHFG